MVARMSVVAVGLVALCAAACTRTESGEREARKRYNEGVAAMTAGEWDKASTAFLDARDKARGDGELRYRATYNLAFAYSKRADAAKDKPEEALEHLSTAAAWFRDAVRMRPKDKRPRENLELVLRQRQRLRDKSGEAERAITKRLEKAIEDQRTTRDTVRQLMTRVAEAGAKAEPIGFQREFEAQATTERALLADVGTIVDLVGDEIDTVEATDEAQRKPEDKAKLVQYKGLERYLFEARTAMADARRALRRLQGERAHERLSAALRALKRAREQLQHPVAVLQGIVRDQAMLASHTGALESVTKPELSVGSKAPAKAPPWLTTIHLAERQTDTQTRTDELAKRLEALGQVDPQAAEKAMGKPLDAKEKRLIEQARGAAPFVADAAAAMTNAHAALQSGMAGLATATAEERKSLDSLARALERFSGIRQLIELAYRDHKAVVGLLTPKDDKAGDKATDKAGGKAAATAKSDAPMTSAERTQAIDKATKSNIDRMKRLAGLLADELAQIDAKAKAPQQPGAQPVDPKQAEQEKQKYQLAETLRAKALASLVTLDGIVTAIAANTRRGAKEPAPLATAEDADKHLEELRRLFFSLVEHIKQLGRDQANTHDNTGTAHAADDDKRAPLVGPLADFQTKHHQMGDALTRALAQQADAAAKAGDPKAAETAKRMGDAAKELGDATTEMQNAAKMLNDASTQTISYDLAPVVEHQKNALEHIAKAIQILEPPKPQDQKNQDQKQDQQQQQQQQQQMSRKQADRRLQAIRDREAKRRRDKDKNRKHSDTVEKDW